MTPEQRKINLVEWLIYAAACQYVKNHEDDEYIEYHDASKIVCMIAAKRGFSYFPGILEPRAATTHVNYDETSQYRNTHFSAGAAARVRK